MSKREEILKVIQDILEVYEGKDGFSYNKIKEQIGTTDTSLKKFISEIKTGKRQLVLYAPNMKSKMRMRDIIRAANKIGLKIEKRLRLRDDTTGKSYITNKAYVILNIPIRRVKQFISESISLPEGDKNIDLLTGQVIKPDKATGISFIEMQALYGKGLDYTIKELIKFRGGDINSYSEYLSQLLENGYVNGDNIGDNSVARSSVIASNYLKAMHIDNNLVKGSKLNE